MFLFAEIDPVSSFFGNILIYMFLFAGLIGMLLKRVDKGGAIKRSAGKATFRGGLKLFDILKKW